MANHPMDRLWDARDIPKHAAQVEAIKRHGALAAIELAHSGMRARNITSGLPVIGPSALPVLRPEIPAQSRAMDLADIRAFRDRHRAAARRAVEAGYDILYVYAAHNLSILSHFLSLRTNQRSDEYGGALQNRARLLREVLEDTAEVAHAAGRAVALRFSVDEGGKTPGLRADGEGRDLVEMLAETPDLWDVNLAGWANDSQTSRFSEEGFQLPFTDFVKRVTMKPVVGVGRFTSPDMMVRLVKSGRLDLIGAARPSIADPFLPTKIREGRADEIRECIGCNVCVSMDSCGLPLRCTQNPTIAEEWRRGWHPEIVTAGSRKHALIVGAGPAGLECGWTLARAGWKATIAEKATEAGGRVSRESRLPGLGAWARVRDHRLYMLGRRAEADIYLSSPMTAEDAAGFGADEVIVATGARWRADGVGSSHFTPRNFGGLKVITPDDVMDGAAPAGRHVVYDDDHFYMASVIAERLADEGCQVAYATPLPTVATWTDFTLEQGAIIARLAEKGVALNVNTALVEGGGFASTLTGAPVDIAADHIAMVGARTPVDDLAALKDELGPRLHMIGDCVAPATIQAAIFSGHRVARALTGCQNAGAEYGREIAAVDPDPKRSVA